MEYDRIIQVHILTESYRFTLSMLDVCGTEYMKIIKGRSVSTFHLYV